MTELCSIELPNDAVSAQVKLIVVIQFVTSLSLDTPTSFNLNHNLNQ
jgi:hypothetical protein